MEPDANPPIVDDDPASAFAALRGEVSLLRRAVEGLTAERQNAPDYTPTLTAITTRLGEFTKFMAAVAHSPSMRLTPESVAQQIATGVEAARAADRATLDGAAAALRSSTASIDGIVEKAWAADRQNRWLLGTGIGGALTGALFWAIVPGEIARALPTNWNVPEKMAARTLRLDVGNIIECGRRSQKKNLEEMALDRTND